MRLQGIDGYGDRTTGNPRTSNGITHWIRSTSGVSPPAGGGGRGVGGGRHPGRVARAREGLGEEGDDVACEDGRMLRWGTSHEERLIPVFKPGYWRIEISSRRGSQQPGIKSMTIACQGCLWPPRPFVDR